MENLDKALAKITNKESDRAYDMIKSQAGEGRIHDFIYGLVTQIGYNKAYTGSDLYDSDRESEFTLELLGYSSGGSDDADYSVDYDDIAELKRTYANHINEKISDKKFDLSNIEAVKVFFISLQDDHGFKGNLVEFCAILSKSSHFASDIYDQLNQPRG